MRIGKPRGYWRFFLLLLASVPVGIPMSVFCDFLLVTLLFLLRYCAARFVDLLPARPSPSALARIPPGTDTAGTPREQWLAASYLHLALFPAMVFPFAAVSSLACPSDLHFLDFLPYQLTQMRINVPPSIFAKHKFAVHHLSPLTISPIAPYPDPTPLPRNPRSHPSLPPPCSQPDSSVSTSHT